MPRSNDRSAATAIAVVRLADLPALAGELVAKVRADNFSPDVIVYVETGARLLARELSMAMQVPLAAIFVRRGGHGLKQVIAPLLRRLPVGIRDWLRRLEENVGVHRFTQRKAQLRDDFAWVGRRVLLLDDAADTGRTLAAAQKILQARGVPQLRTAVLAATTVRARAAVDYYLFDANCRMPWSSDSEERIEAQRRALQIFASS